MQLYPAIDMKDGKCVRLSQGLFDQVKIYADTPADMAALWCRQGATFLHLVDLDGALAGHSINEEAIEQIVRTVSVPVQLGGGIRSEQAIDHMLRIGVTRCIIGTKAVEHPDFIGDMVKKFGSERIVVGVDAKDGMVATEGWEKVSNRTALELCQAMKGYGVRHIVYTDIAKDGMLSGPNIPYTRMLTEETGINIIASGGVSCMDDLTRLYDAGIHGAIIGKALYEKRIDLHEAVKRYEVEVKGI